MTVNLDQQKSLIKKTTVDIPNLMYSPFLSAEEQTKFYTEDIPTNLTTQLKERNLNPDLPQE